MVRGNEVWYYKDNDRVMLFGVRKRKGRVIKENKNYNYTQYINCFFKKKF